MTKDQLQQELKKKVKPGIKPSHLRKSKSLSDIPTTQQTPQLQKSKSQLEIPTQPSELVQLQEQVKFHAQTAQNYLQSLQLAQAKITELEEELKLKEIFIEAPEENISELKEKIDKLEEQILQLRLDKIKEFGDYYEKKQDLETELEENITEGISEIKRLENKLLATNKKKLELAQKLSQTQTKNTKLELKLLNNQEPDSNSHFLTDYWPVILLLSLYCYTIWLLSTNQN